MTEKFISKDNFLQKEPPIEAKMKVLDHIYLKKVTMFNRIAQYSKIWVTTFALLFVVMLGVYFNNYKKEQAYISQLIEKIDNTQIIVSQLITIANEEDSIQL